MAPQVKMLKGMPEDLAKFYAASIVQVGDASCFTNASDF